MTVAERAAQARVEVEQARADADARVAAAERATEEARNTDQPVVGPFQSTSWMMMPLGSAWSKNPTWVSDQAI